MCMQVIYVICVGSIHNLQFQHKHCSLRHLQAVEQYVTFYTEVFGELQGIPEHACMWIPVYTHTHTLVGVFKSQTIKLHLIR